MKGAKPSSSKHRRVPGAIQRAERVRVARGRPCTRSCCPAGSEEAREASAQRPAALGPAGGSPLLGSLGRRRSSGAEQLSCNQMGLNGVLTWRNAGQSRAEPPELSTVAFSICDSACGLTPIALATAALDVPASGSGWGDWEMNRYA